MNEELGLGANVSHFDSRTFKHDTTLAVPLISGGYDYLPEDIEHQHHEGICTAISLTQNAGKALGKKFSGDFNYLCQKKFYDFNWQEGSSIFNSLKVGKNIGFLLASDFNFISEEDRYLPYSEYIAKLQAIPDAEIERLKKLCTDKLTGYASLNIDAQSLAKGILDSRAGILCRYDVGKEWFTPSWLPKDIDPLKAPKEIISGHAITMNRFDLSGSATMELTNTWGPDWDDQGKGHTKHAFYSCTEAWIPYYDTVPTPLPPKFLFTQDMQQGQDSQDIKQLQKRLGVKPESGFYGPLTRHAVYQYQLANVPMSWYEKYVLMGKICGGKTRAKLNIT